DNAGFAMKTIVTILLASAACMACGATAPVVAASQPFPSGEVVRIPLPPGTLPSRETVTSMVATIFKPAGAGPFPVVVFSHGRAHGQANRDALKLGIGHEQVRYWLAKGVAIVSPIRPGYGATRGGNPEDSNSRLDAAGQCAGKPDFNH